MLVFGISVGSGRVLTESGLVSERNVDEAVVSQGRHGSESSALLTSALSAGGDEPAQN
jgi:hypothetical protein